MPQPSHQPRSGMLVLVLVRVLVVVVVVMAGPGLMAGGVRVTHPSRMAGKPCRSTSTTALRMHLRPSCWV